jgi:glycosyltransferase involved in cell wall biosynthesis
MVSTSMPSLDAIPTSSEAGMRVVMFVRNDVMVDARVLKEAATLRDVGHHVTIIGTTRPDTPDRIDREARDGFSIIRVPLPRWRHWWRWFRAPSRLWSMLRRRGAAPGERMDGLDWLAMWRFGNLGWARAAARAAGPADVYHGHDLTGLPAAVFANELHGATARVVYDSHELFATSGAVVGRPSWAVDWLARRELEWAAQADALVTVSYGYAAVLGPRLGKDEVVVVHNCPPRPVGELVRSDRIREAAGIPAGPPIILYHGALQPGRGIRQLAEAMLEPGLEHAHLVFLGWGASRDEAAQLALEPRFGGRIHILPPVAPLDVVNWVASADIAAMPIQAHSQSYYLSTPNKMFEAFAAGVPVVASDFPGMRSIVAEDPDRPLGELCDPADPASIGAAMRRLLELPQAARAELGARCRRAAQERWNWETESTRLVELYRDLGATGDRDGRGAIRRRA